MFGTRHEKVVIVLTAYVIGFTTAFIAFGVSEVKTPAIENVHQTASVNTAKEDSAFDYKKIHQNIRSIGTDEFGLYVDVGGYNRTISAFSSALESADEISDGFAFAYHKPLISEDGWFAFFCEQKKEGDSTCVPFVYSLFDDTVHLVTLNGSPVAITSDVFTVSWTTTNFLVVDGFFSESNQEPWRFIETIPEEVPTESTEEDSVEVPASPAPTEEVE